MVRFLFRKIATLALASIFSRIISIMARSNFCSSPLYSLFLSRLFHALREFSFKNSYRLAGINKSGETALFFISRKPRPSARRQKKSITYSLCNSSSVIIQCSFRSAILYRWLAGRLLLHLSVSVSAPSDALLRYLSFQGWHQSLRTSHPDMRQFHFALITVGKMF